MLLKLNYKPHRSYSRESACLVTRGLFVCVGFLMLADCTASQPFPGLPRLSVTAQFGIENLCDTGVSPRIGLANVPSGTTHYVVQMTNVDVLIQSPWRETIPLTSKSEIPEGGAKTYAGPCLGDYVRFPPLAPSGYTYRVEVLAEGANNLPLAYGTVYAMVQSPYLTAKRLRLQLQGAPNASGRGPSGAPPPPTTPYMSSPGSYSGFYPGPTPAYGVLQ